MLQQKSMIGATFCKKRVVFNYSVVIMRRTKRNFLFAAAPNARARRAAPARPLAGRATQITRFAL